MKTYVKKAFIDFFRRKIDILKLQSSVAILGAEEICKEDREVINQIDDSLESIIYCNRADQYTCAVEQLFCSIKTAIQKMRSPCVDRQSSANVKYNCLKLTVLEISSPILSMSDSVIYFLFLEEFPIDVMEYCNVSILRELLDEGFIDEVIIEKIMDLQNKFQIIALCDELKTVASIKSSNMWKNLINLADEVLALFYY